MNTGLPDIVWLPATPEWMVESTASKALRGGDWGYGLENATCAYCNDKDPSRSDALNGFRLVLAESLG